MNEKIDVVYVLGHGSTWADNELRYSLRSLELFVEDLGQVFVVGSRPKWLTGVVHLPYDDKYTCKERNIMEKVAYACGHPDLTQRFLHVHDDHFTLARARGKDLPNWCGSSLERLAMAVKVTNHWRDAVVNTNRVLVERGFDNRNFDLHFPIVFDKDLYPKVMDEYDWRGTPRGFVVKSLYANTLQLPWVQIGDVKLMGRFTLEQLVDKLRGRPWFSVSNSCLNLTMKELFQHLYPTPSRYELP